MNKSRAVVIALFFGTAACLTAALALAKPPEHRFAGATVSHVIFPPQQIPLRFSHVFHLKEAGLDCVFCHENAPESESSLDNLIPAEEPCTMCHAIERQQPEKKVEAGTPPARCDACHRGFEAEKGVVARVEIPRPNLKFSHKAHVDRDVACQVCHGDLAKEGVELATRDQLPRMKLCLDCHDGRRAPDECTTCHLSGPGGLVRTTYDSGSLEPSGQLRGAAHDLSFRDSHRFAAQNDDEYCRSCHRQEFCTNCHDGVVKPMDFHAGDYISLHPVDARRNRKDCSSCHRLQTFCVGCHSRSGVSPDGKGTEFGPLLTEKERAFHPQGWVEYAPGLVSGPDARGKNHHSFQAQRNIRQCVSCHRESFCQNCHSAEPGSFRINPHPRNWRGSRRCRSLMARAGRMCLRCHIDLSEADCDQPMR